jgi:arginine kinase
MLNSLVHSRDPQPIIFMIKYLSNLVTGQELEEHGIVVTGPVPQRIPIITYPKFEPECNSLLKKHLTREIWTNMKKKSTNRGGNIQMCVKSGVERPLCKIGAMATDDEAYKTFGDLFTPIIKDLHVDYDQRYSYKFEELRPDVVDDTISEIMMGVSKINNFKIEVHRNFRQTPFTPLMTKEAKLKIERKVVEVLGDLYGSYI